MLGASAGFVCWVPLLGGVLRAACLCWVAYSVPVLRPFALHCVVLCAALCSLCAALRALCAALYTMCTTYSVLHCVYYSACNPLAGTSCNPLRQALLVVFGRSWPSCQRHHNEVRPHTPLLSCCASHAVPLVLGGERGGQRCVVCQVWQIFRWLHLPVVLRGPVCAASCAGHVQLRCERHRASAVLGGLVSIYILLVSIYILQGRSVYIYRADECIYTGCVYV